MSERYIDMGIWMCRAKFIDPASVKREGNRVRKDNQGLGEPGRP